jgi:heme exporter protein C
MIFNAIIAVWVTAGLLLAFAMPPAVNLVKTPIAFFHVPMAISMLAAFLASGWNGVRWLQTRELHRDSLSLAFAEVGTVIAVIALITGSIWAKLNWNSYWNWDPQQVGIVATLLTYAAMFALRGATEESDKQRDLWAVYAIVGVLAAIFWTMVFRRLLPTLHPAKTLVESDSLFRFALWFNVIGYVMVMVRLAQIRARLETALARTREWQWEA